MSHLQPSLWVTGHWAAFFYVYGPWGRPDMAPMLFAGRSWLANRSRCSTARCSRSPTSTTLLGVALLRQPMPNPEFDSLLLILRPAAPHRSFIGNSQPTELLRFIEEQALVGSVGTFNRCSLWVATAADTFS